MLIYSLLSVQTEVGISILVSSFMALIEFTIIFFNITIVEKTNIPKSLKRRLLMITIENLCKAYNDKILFKNFHLEIPDSRFLVISGESGCGKSTLLNMIGGIETPDKGSIIVNGFDVAKKGKKQKYFKEVVGFLFQNFALLENKTVKENLEIIKKIR